MRTLRSLFSNGPVARCDDFRPAIRAGRAAPQSRRRRKGAVPRRKVDEAAARRRFPRSSGRPVIPRRSRAATACMACIAARVMAPILRGGDQGGPNLLRSQVVLNDQAGELILPIVQNGQRGASVMPPIPLTPRRRPCDRRVHAQRGGDHARAGQPAAGSDAGRSTCSSAMRRRGQAYFAAKCSSCHSVSGDLQGIGSRVPDPMALQNYWLSAGGGSGARRSRRRARGCRPGTPRGDGDGHAGYRREGGRCAGSTRRLSCCRAPG